MPLHLRSLVDGKECMLLRRILKLLNVPESMPQFMGFRIKLLGFRATALSCLHLMETAPRIQSRLLARSSESTVSSLQVHRGEASSYLVAGRLLLTRGDRTWVQEPGNFRPEFDGALQPGIYLPEDVFNHKNHCTIPSENKRHPTDC